MAIEQDEAAAMTFLAANSSVVEEASR